MVFIFQYFCLQEPLLKMELNNPALLSGNWSQLCATCKVCFPCIVILRIFSAYRHLYSKFLIQLILEYLLDCEASACKALFHLWSLCWAVWSSLSLGIKLYWQGASTLMTCISVAFCVAFCAPLIYPEALWFFSSSK